MTTVWETVLEVCYEGPLVDAGVNPVENFPQVITQCIIIIMTLLDRKGNPKVQGRCPGHWLLGALRDSAFLSLPSGSALDPYTALALSG